MGARRGRAANGGDAAPRGPALGDPAASSTRSLPPSGGAAQRARAARPVPAHRRARGATCARADGGDRPRRRRCARRRQRREDPRHAPAGSASRARAGWPATALVVTNAHVVAGQKDTRVLLRGREPGLDAHARSRSTRATTSRSCACPGSRAGAAARRPAAAGHLGRDPRLPAQRALRRARRAARRDARGDHAGRLRARAGARARSPRCAARCAPATPAGRWSTATGRVVTTVFAATTPGRAAASACPTRSCARRSRARAGAVSTGPCAG